MAGSIEIICGPMFSGKTEELIKRVNRAKYAKQKFLLFKPRMDNRYSETDVASHNGIKEEAIAINNSIELEVAIENHRSHQYGHDFYPMIVAVEEVQFFDDAIVQTLYDLKSLGIRVIVAGLDMDWQGQPFPITSHLMSIADKVDKQSAVCVKCGEDGTYSYLKNKSGEQIQVGATEKYEARCFVHWGE